MVVPGEPRIRAAVAADAASLAALSAELGYPAEPDEMARRLAALPPTDAVYVAEIDGSVAGWVHVALTRSLVVPVHVQILGLVVGQEWREHGIGRALMARAETWTLEQGATRVRLRSAVECDGAHGFYQRLGYREQKTQRVFVREVDR